MANFTRGEIAEIDAGVRPAGCLKTMTFDAGIESGALAGKAALTTVLTGANNDMVFTAEANGVAYNDVSVEYRDPGFPSYTIKTIMEGAKAIVVLLGTNSGTKANATITTDATEVTVGDTVTLGTGNDARTYTFKTTMTAPYDVKRDGTAATTLANLKKAINATGTEGTEYYAGLSVHPSVTATDIDATTLKVEAKAIGTYGNAIEKSESSSHLDWDGTGAYLTGGLAYAVTSTAAQVKTSIEASTAAAALVDIANSGADTGAGAVTTMAQSYLTTGSDGKVPLFTVTGTVVGSLRGYCETDLTGANATLVHGITGSTNLLIPIITCTTIDAGKGIDNTGLVANGLPLLVKPTTLFAGEVFATTATAATTAGKIHYVLDWIGMTSGATVEPA